MKPGAMHRDDARQSCAAPVRSTFGVTHQAWLLCG